MDQGLWGEVRMEVKLKSKNWEIGFCPTQVFNDLFSNISMLRTTEKQGLIINNPKKKKKWLLMNRSYNVVKKQCEEVKSVYILTFGLIN